jgi:hypothetical protein
VAKMSQVVNLPTLALIASIIFEALSNGPMRTSVRTTEDFRGLTA